MISLLTRIIRKALAYSELSFGGDVYMRRWRLGHHTPFGIRLHHIVRSDADRELHCHPFDFISIILAGGYTEHRDDGTATYYPPGSVLFRRAETLHRLELDRPAWTLVLRGPHRRVWGFKTDKGWVPWHEFVFTPGAAGGENHTPVTVGATPDETYANLVAAINHHHESGSWWRDFLADFAYTAKLWGEGGRDRQTEIAELLDREDWLEQRRLNEAAEPIIRSRTVALWHPCRFVLDDEDDTNLRYLCLVCKASGPAHLAPQTVEDLPCVIADHGQPEPKS